ncbi:general secretion pathway protein GspB [Thermodesulfobacteriota bacterium]
MSSILKALKKLENTYPEQNDSLFRSQRIRLLKTTPRSAKGFWSFTKWFFIIFTVLALSAGGWLILSRKPQEKPLDWVAKKETESVKSTRLPDKMSSFLNLPQKETPAASLIKKSDSIKTVKKKPGFARKPLEKTPAPELKKEIKPTEARRLSDKKPGLVLAPKEMSVTETEKEFEPKIKSEPFAELPVKQVSETGLELQAIAWSGDTGSRIAVINGRIVREGGSVEDVSIVRINQDDVVFKKGGETWQQVFRLK